MKKIFGVLVVSLTVFVAFFFSANQTRAEVGESHSWSHSDWSSRVLWEAKYALSQDADGYSDNHSGSGLSEKWYGDWDYANDDTTERDNAEDEGYGIMGTIGGPNGSGYYLGGQCTYFVRLVLYRATYWYFSDHYAMHNYPYSVYDNLGGLEDDPTQFQPGWMLIDEDTHYAIAEKRATISGVSGWWVIDSNWVGSYVIGKHFMSDATLESQGYRGKSPDKGTWNW